MQIAFKLQVIKPDIIGEKCNKKKTIHIEKQPKLLLLFVRFVSMERKSN